ncbi:MAG: winged helix-turn-helix domain-containing protein [Proteobacteria bacterium]|nr:winged helix-turn-helix domain-containing protein [Pseudomonadota bacterium]
MHAKKVCGRIARIRECPDVLNIVARNIGEGLARGQREELQQVARELAAKSLEADSNDAQANYWAGFAAALGTLLASYEAAHEESDIRATAMRVLANVSAEAVLLELRHGPATGAELASRLGVTPGATSKILKSLRNVGLARVLGGLAGDETLPERGARKSHVLTSLGSSVAQEILATTSGPQRAIGAAAR